MDKVRVAEKLIKLAEEILESSKRKKKAFFIYSPVATPNMTVEEAKDILVRYLNEAHQTVTDVSPRERVITREIINSAERVLETYPFETAEEVEEFAAIVIDYPSWETAEERDILRDVMTKNIERYLTRARKGKQAREKMPYAMTVDEAKAELKRDLEELRKDFKYMRHEDLVFTPDIIDEAQQVLETYPFETAEEVIEFASGLYKIPGWETKEERDNLRKKVRKTIDKYTK